MENKSNKKVDVIIKTTYHWAVFAIPVLMAICGIVYAFKENFKIGFSCFIFGLIIGLIGYFINYKDKSFILTPNKVYIMNKKEKLITINLSHAELLGYSYTNTILEKIFGYSHISFHIKINGQNKVLNYFFVKNGQEFILTSFYQSEKYLSKLDPNYKKKLDKPRGGINKQAGLDRVE